jgi:hypothetical protein
MKTLAFLVALTVVVLPAQAASTRNPRVRVPETVPFTVHGTGFAPRERVAVSVMVNTRRAHLVGANAAGAFTTTFRALKLEACVGYEVQARGSRGSRATWSVVPECPNGEPEPLLPRDPIPGKR